MLSPDFCNDLQRFGPAMAFRREENRERVRDFRHRQLDLLFLFVGAMFWFLATDWAVFAVAAVWIAIIGAAEARRMRRFGRYYRTRRSEGEV